MSMLVKIVRQIHDQQFHCSNSLLSVSIRIPSTANIVVDRERRDPSVQPTKCLREGIGNGTSAWVQHAHPRDEGKKSAHENPVDRNDRKECPVWIVHHRPRFAQQKSKAERTVGVTKQSKR